LTFFWALIKWYKNLPLLPSYTSCVGCFLDVLLEDYVYNGFVTKFCLKEIMSALSITKIHALQVLDSRGIPTVATQVTLSNGITGFAMVPSGGSTGNYEALELRDGDSQVYSGKGVLQAVENVNTKIADALNGMETDNQRAIDMKMLELDGTDTKSNLGANAVLSVSLAVSRAAAKARNLPLYEYLRQLFWPDNDGYILPVPMVNVFNGGKHAVGSVDLQEFMIVPFGAPSFKEAVRWGTEIYHMLKKQLHERGLPVGVGDEGGFMPKLSSHQEVLDTLMTAITSAGYEPGIQVGLAMDPAASEFFEGGKYHLTIEDKVLTTAEMVKMYKDWAATYPIVSMEDVFDENDWAGFTQLTAEIGDVVQIVGDDLFVTNTNFIQRGITEKAANSVLIKVNQIGTLTETANAIDLALRNDMTAVVSHRSGETEDTFIADLVVAANTGQIKTGSLARSDRVAKYNRLLVIEDALGADALFVNPFGAR
jgi:enolase